MVHDIFQRHLSVSSTINNILGDPGAVSRVAGIFVAKVYCKPTMHKQEHAWITQTFLLSESTCVNAAKKQNVMGTCFFSHMQAFP